MAVKIKVRSNAGVDSMLSANSMDVALELARAQRNTGNHMVTITEPGDNRPCLRWDRDAVRGENHWRRVDPDEMQVLGPIREVVAMR